MDLFVCGDALWISCGTWIAFWNGAIGALVGALVAVLAIVKTIGTQRQLFAIERAEAYTANLIAERRRKAELDRQLESQRADVQLQLDVAAQEASRQRELAAIADLMATLHEIWWRLEDHPDSERSQDRLMRARAAASRWGLEASFEEHRVLEGIVIDFMQVAVEASAAASAKLPGADRLAEVVIDMIAKVERFAHAWPRLDPEKRIDVLIALAEETTEWKNQTLGLAGTLGVRPKGET